MTRDELQDIHGNIRAILDDLQGLDEVEDWDGDQAGQAEGDLADLFHYANRLRDYYQQYRGIE